MILFVYVLSVCQSGRLLVPSPPAPLVHHPGLLDLLDLLDPPPPPPDTS